VADRKDRGVTAELVQEHGADGARAFDATGRQRRVIDGGAGARGPFDRPVVAMVGIEPHGAQSIAVRIQQLEAELAALRRQQIEALVTVIVTTIGPGVFFTARELFDHQRVSKELSEAFKAVGIRSVRQLGKQLRRLGLEPVGLEHHAVLWRVPDHSPRPPSLGAGVRV
jgi:hypothetical protein